MDSGLSSGGPCLSRKEEIHLPDDRLDRRTAGAAPNGESMIGDDDTPSIAAGCPASRYRPRPRSAARPVRSPLIPPRFPEDCGRCHRPPTMRGIPYSRRTIPLLRSSVLNRWIVESYRGGNHDPMLRSRRGSLGAPPSGSEYSQKAHRRRPQRAGVPWARGDN